MEKQTEPMDASKQCCPNSACCARGQMGAGNIRIHGHHPQRYRCHTCQKTFSARRGTMMEGLRKPSDVIVIVVTLLAYLIDPAITCDPKQPPLESHVGIERWQREIQLEEHLLQHVRG